MFFIRSRQLLVYYDGACPKCVRDRRRYEKLAGEGASSVEWLDITDREDLLRRKGIDPERALRELHVEDEQGDIYRELDAYILLMAQSPWLKPLAVLVGLPIVRPWLSRLYRHSVDRRLRREGRG